MQIVLISLIGGGKEEEEEGSGKFVKMRNLRKLFEHFLWFIIQVTVQACKRLFPRTFFFF